MRYLLDTNLLCKEMQPRAGNWIVHHQLQIAIASMTVAEVAQGIESLPRGQRRTRPEGFLRETLEDYQVLPFDTVAALANNLEVDTENETDFMGVGTVNPLKD